jgi:hypothetical protein
MDVIQVLVAKNNMDFNKYLDALEKDDRCLVSWCEYTGGVRIFGCDHKVGYGELDTLIK